MAAVKCCVRKARFFAVRAGTKREARALFGFQPHKGENLFCFLFPDPVNVGLIPVVIALRIGIGIGIGIAIGIGVDIGVGIDIGVDIGIGIGIGIDIGIGIGIDIVVGVDLALPYKSFMAQLVFFVN